MGKKIYSLLGLCQKAGRLNAGEVACEAAVKGGSAKLILVAADASGNTKKKFRDSAEFYQVPILEFGTKEELGHAIGKDIRSVVCVTEEGFSKKIRDLILIYCENNRTERAE